MFIACARTEEPTNRYKLKFQIKKDPSKVYTDTSDDTKNLTDDLNEMVGVYDTALFTWFYK